MIDERPKAIKELFQYIERGEEAISILEEIWLHDSTNMYDLKVSEKSMERIRNFFGFDDSE